MTQPIGLLSRISGKLTGNTTTTTIPQSPSQNSLDPSLIALTEQAAKDKQKKAFLASKEAKELAAWVKAEYDKMKTARIGIQREWYINMSMFYGQQYLELMNPNVPGSLAVGSLGVPKAPRHRIRATVNLIRPMARTEISRLTSQKPSASVVPASSDDEAMMSAQTAEAIIEYLSYRRDFDTQMIREAFWQVITGNGFLKSWWDNNKVAKSTNTVEGTPAVGDVCYGVVTPFNLFVPDLLVEDIEDQAYVFEAYTVSVQKVLNDYPGIFGDGKNQLKPDCVGTNEIFDTKYFLIGGNSANAKPDSVLFVEAWIKPGAIKLLPNGGFVKMAGSAIVDISLDGFPYSHGEYPYTHFKLIESGKFYGDSTITDLKHLNKEYNRTRSAIIESKNRMGKPQFVAAKGSIDPSKLTSEPGLIIMYNQGYTPPTPVTPPELPRYVIEELDRIKADFEDISGQHQVSKGQSPGGGVNAATAISFLQERDDSLLYTAYQSIESGCEKLWRQSLTLYADYVDLPRIIRITGADGAFDSLEFKGSDIAQGLDVRVEGGSSLPTSKPARQALLMDMFDRQAIDKNQLLDLMDMGGTKTLVERLRTDMRAAQRENIKMKKITPQQTMAHEQQMMLNAQQGSPDQQDPVTGEWNYNQNPDTWPPMVEVNEWDNHEVHIATHDNYRKGQEFETLPDLIKQEFKKHIDLHKLALQGQQAPATMGMPPQSGSPTGGDSAGGGSPDSTGMPPSDQGMPPQDSNMPPQPTS